MRYGFPRRQRGYITPFMWQTAARGGGGNTDPHFASVVLLAVNDNAADATTTFVDQSSAARTLTANGNVQYDTAQAPTGMTSSALFDGTGDYISAVDSADWDFGTGDFTVEAWVRFSSLPASTVQAFVSNYGGSTTGWTQQFRADGSNRLVFGTSGDSPLEAFAWAPVIDTWYPVATSRASGTLRSYIAGTQIGGDVANAEDITGSTAILAIGRIGSLNAQYLIGWMASVRVTKGVARYTGTSYTVPTLPLPTS